MSQNTVSSQIIQVTADDSSKRHYLRLFYFLSRHHLFLKLECVFLTGSAGGHYCSLTGE